MNRQWKLHLTGLILAGLILSLVGHSHGRNNIRTTFLSLYPHVDGTPLDDLPSRSNHCGACHFDFSGGGPRNPYGLGIEIGLNAGLTREQAILAIEGSDPDGDGYTSLIEITDLLNFGNTPTFPGLSAANAGSVSSIPLHEIEPYLTPSAGSDTTPPTVTILSPDGGEVLQAGMHHAVIYIAEDASGITRINVYHSDDGGAGFKPVARNEAPGTEFSWFVPNRPGSSNVIRVEAFDGAGNTGYDDSDAFFTILSVPAGFVPTTLRDMDLPGTQPLEGAVLDDPAVSCVSCHGGYDQHVEAWHNWGGSMMGQAARDPLFWACVAIAEQDAPSVGDLCIRCHSPGGWQEGRSVDTSGGQLTAKDRHGVQCDFCHRMVDHNYIPGVSPIEDLAVLDNIDPLPLQYGGGQFINDPVPIRRGPYEDLVASHASLESPFHRSSDLCGVCHDVSNPVFIRIGPEKYVPAPFDQAHPDMDHRNMFPVERTYSEWSVSEYAAIGVYAPQFAGDKPDGIVSSCQDCHMRDVSGYGASQAGVPYRTDIGLHDFMGGNTFIPEIIPHFFPGEVDPAQLQDAVDRAVAMLQLAATMEVTPRDYGISVRVVNETGHKLPSGYPEGRRIWLNVRAYDEADELVFESGAYDFETAALAHDEQAKVYEIQPGLSPSLAAALGLPDGKSFHFVINDTIYLDNRIPPRGFTNAAFQEIQSPTVAHTYEDGQYWDDTEYELPATAVLAEITLYYQTLSREYVEFLRDANFTNSAGQDLYNAWEIHGKGAPVAMATETVPVEVVPSGVREAEGAPPIITALEIAGPNPFRDRIGLVYALPGETAVRLEIFDVSGRRIRALDEGVRPGGRYQTVWDGRDARGGHAPSGIYFVRLDAGRDVRWEKVVRMR